MDAERQERAAAGHATLEQGRDLAADECPAK
jgi:hypothetical protein